MTGAEKAGPTATERGLVGRGGGPAGHGAGCAGADAGVTIDCDACAMQGTSACDDCVVSFLLGREPDDAVVIDADEARAMRMLEQAGLLPSLRFESRVG